MFSRHGIAQNSSFVLVRSAERKHSDLFDLNRFVRFLSIGHSFGVALSNEESNKSVQISFATFPLALPGYTSNHNIFCNSLSGLKSVSIGGYTSNHNEDRYLLLDAISVSIGGYTSNHNRRCTTPTKQCSVSIGGYTSNHNSALLHPELGLSVSIGGYTSNHNVGNAKV